MASLRGRTKSAEEKTAEAARHAAIRAKAIEATALLGAQSRDGAIDIEKLADLLGAEIVYGDLDGAKARVVQIGDRARIIISKKIVGVGAIRFCIAHEIGHLLLWPQRVAAHWASAKLRSACASSQAPRREARASAAGVPIRAPRALASRARTPAAMRSGP